MSRDAAGVYSAPPGTEAIPGALVTAEQFNDTIADLGIEITNSATKEALVVASAPNLTTGSAPSYVVAAPTIKLLDAATAFSFRVHAVNPGSALAVAGNLTNASATVANVTIPAGIAIGQTVTSGTAGVPAKTKVTAFAITDTVTGKGTITLSAAFTGTTTVAASLSLTPINPTLTFSGVAPGTFTGPLANNTKRLLAPDGTGLKAGELDPRLSYRAFYSLALDAVVVLDLPRVVVDATDPRPGPLSEKILGSDGLALPVQTDPVTGEKRIILPAGLLQVGDIVQSGRPGLTSQGYLRCNGATYLQSAQSALFAAVGHAFGTLTNGGQYAFGTTNQGISTASDNISFAVGFYSAQYSRYFTLVNSTGGVRIDGSTDGSTFSGGVGNIGSGDGSTSRVKLQGIAEGGGKIVAVAENFNPDASNTTTHYVVSADGLTFATSGGFTLAQGAFRVKCLAYGAGLFVMLQSSLAACKTSPDGVTWTDRNYSLAPLPTPQLAFGNGIFVAIGTNGGVITSPDGLTWTTQTPTGLAGLSGAQLRFSSGTFVYGAASSQTYYTSTDGIAWTARTTGFAAGACPLACMNGLWIFTGPASSFVFTRDFETHSQQAISATGNPAYIAFASPTLVGVANIPNFQTFSLSYNFATSFKVPNIAPNPVSYFIKSA